MPVTWSIRAGLLTLHFVGVVERHEIERALADALSDARAQPGMRLLWDARMTETPVSADDVAWRLELVSSLAGRGLVCRGAILFGDDHRATAGILHLEMRKEPLGFPAAAFTDEAEALAWLATDTT